MTNEEKKSNEIATEYLSGHDRFEVTYEEMREAVLEMAEWKDAQLKEYLEKKKEEIELNMGNPQVGTSLFMAKDCMLCLINEIINELFKGE